MVRTHASEEIRLLKIEFKSNALDHSARAPGENLPEPEGSADSGDAGRRKKITTLDTVQPRWEWKIRTSKVDKHNFTSIVPTTDRAACLLDAYADSEAINSLSAGTKTSCR